jgi:hypothetical protein
MEAIRLRIVAVVCSGLVAAGLSYAARPGDPSAAPSSKPPSNSVPALCVRAPALCSAEYQGGGPPQTAAEMGEVSTLELPDGTVVADPAQAGAQQQPKPGSGTEPSLEGLGFPSSAIKGSVKEQELLNKRSHMLQIHQKLGLITAVPMAVSLFTGPGAKGHHGMPGSPGGRNLHATLGGVTAGLYIATAYYAIRAPKVQGTEPRGLIRLHRALVWVHGPGMVITPILGAIAYSQLSNGERIHGAASYHSVAATTTFISYVAALLSVSLK